MKGKRTVYSDTPRFTFCQRGGFTFVEMLLVVSIMATVMIAVFHTLANGLDIWKRAYAIDQEEDALILLEKLTMDLHNLYPYSLYPVIEGNARILRCATLVRSMGDPHSAYKGQMTDQPGRVEYAYDMVHRKITRAEAVYGQSVKGVFPAGRVVLDNVQKLAFRYYVNTKFGMEWKDTIDDQIPAAVEVSIEYSTLGKRRSLSRMIDVPLGG